MPVKFHLHNGFTPNSTGQIRPASISMDLHPIQPVSKAFNRQCNLNGLTPNLTGQIRLASKAFNRQCNLNGFTPNSTGIYLNGFTPNSTDSTRQAYNVISMDLHPIRLVKFNQHLKPLTGNVISMDLHPI